MDVQSSVFQRCFSDSENMNMNTANGFTSATYAQSRGARPVMNGTTYGASSEKMALLEQRITAPPRQEQQIQSAPRDPYLSMAAAEAGQRASMSQGLSNLGHSNSNSQPHSRHIAAPQDSDSRSGFPVFGSSSRVAAVAHSPSSVSQSIANKSSFSGSMSSNQTLITAHTHLRGHHNSMSSTSKSRMGKTTAEVVVMETPPTTDPATPQSQKPPLSSIGEKSNKRKASIPMKRKSPTIQNSNSKSEHQNQRRKLHFRPTPGDHDSNPYCADLSSDRPKKTPPTNATIERPRTPPSSTSVARFPSPFHTEQCNSSSRSGTDSNQSRRYQPEVTTSTASAKKAPATQQITNYFAPTKKPSNKATSFSSVQKASLYSSSKPPSLEQTSSSSNIIQPSPTPRSSKKTQSTTSGTKQHSHQKEVSELKATIASLQNSLRDKTEQLNAVKNNQTMFNCELRNALAKKEKEIEKLHDETKKRTAYTSDAIEYLIRKETAREQKECRQKLASDSARLGRYVYNRMGINAVEPMWEDGFAVKACMKKRANLQKRRQILENRLRDGWNNENKNNTGEIDKENQSRSSLTVDNSMEREEFEQSIQVHLEELDREEQALNREEETITIEKVAHKKAMRRVADEDSSRFKNRPKLHDRYVLLTQLGRGGFSEVWRAYDLIDLREVAVKIHQVDPRWAPAKVENYTKHVAREYEIHRKVRHPRIVSLYNVFEIDTNTFGTVLECCNGTDLDTLLQERRMLPERQSRAILLQMLSGMKYLSSSSTNTDRQGIIHYDLKPGNILFDEFGDAKITDFGLSKIMDSPDPSESMELTSQGAGTYWYLPPECFVVSQNVRITNKVDVWSIGVIFYQMLFGKRPFGDGQTQEKVLSNNVMLNAREVQFPESPKVSEESMEFIRSCLAYDHILRPSIQELCQHPYVNRSWK